MQLLTTKRVGAGAFWALAGRILGVFAQGLMIFLLPRFLTPEQFGAFSLIAPYILLAGVVGTLGLNDGNVRLLSEALARRDARRVSYLIKTGLILTAFLALIVGNAAAAWLVWNNPDITAYSPAYLLGPTVIVGVVLMGLHLITGESLRGLHDIRVASLLSGGGTGGPVVTLLFALSVSVVYALGFITLTTVMIAYVASLAVVLPFGMYFLWRAKQRSLRELQLELTSEKTDLTEHDLNRELPQPRLTDIVSVCVPLMFVHLLVFCTMNADVWIVHFFFDLNDVGLYAAARRLMLLLTLPGQVAAQAVMSSIPDLAARGKLQELQSLLRKTALLATVPAAAISLVLIAIPSLILTLTCGSSEYSAAAPTLIILSIGNLVVAMCGNPIHALIMTGRHYYGLVVYVIAAALLATLGPWAATHYGVLGVAVASSVCLAFQSIASWILARCTLGIWTHPGWNSVPDQRLAGVSRQEVLAENAPPAVVSSSKVPVSVS